MYIKTLKNIHPEQIYTTSSQYKAIKRAKPNVPFKIKDKTIAKQLIVAELVKKYVLTRHIKANPENPEEVDWLSGREEIETGKYILTIDGEYYLEYKKNNKK